MVVPEGLWRAELCHRHRQTVQKLPGSLSLAWLPAGRPGAQACAFLSVPSTKEHDRPVIFPVPHLHPASRLGTTSSPEGTALYSWQSAGDLLSLRTPLEVATIGRRAWG